MTFSGIEAETLGPGGGAIVLSPSSPGVGEIEIVFSTATVAGPWTVVNDPGEWHETYTSGDQKMHVWVRKRTATSGQPWFQTPDGGVTGCGGYVRYSSIYTGWIVSGAANASAPAVTAPVSGVADYVWASVYATLSAPAGQTDVTPKSGTTGGVIYGSMIGDDAQLNAGSTAPSVTAGVSGGIGGTPIVYGVTVAMLTNRPPNQPSWQSPADGTNLDAAAANDLEFVFSDPDVYDSQSGRDWFYSTDNGATWTETDERTNTTQTITIPAAKFTAGTAVQVQVHTYDLAGAVSVKSNSLHLNFIAKPAPPTFTSPTSSDTITSSSQLVQIAVANSTQIRYQVLGDDGAGHANPSDVIDPETTITTAGVLSFTVTGLPTGQTVHIQAAAFVNGLWTDYADLAIPVTYTAPVLSTVTLTQDPANGRMIVTLATGAPGSGQAAAVSGFLEGRRVTDQIIDWSRTGDLVALNGDTNHQLAAAGVDYEYRVTTTAASGAQSVGPWVGSATGTPDDSSPFLAGGTPANPNGVFV